MGQAAEVIPLRTGWNGHVLERKGGKPDPIWDACEEVLGYAPKTNSELTLWGQKITSLRSAEATPEQIHAVAKWYRKSWPSMDLTITALEKWFSHFLRLETKRQQRQERCPECEVGGGRHSADCKHAQD